MSEKKDPGKFTIRFNIADPQQRAAAELLNRQGRYKAQFITNAMLFYTYAASDSQVDPLLNGAVIQHMVTGQRPKCLETVPPALDSSGTEPDNAPNSTWGSDLGDTDMDSIRRTMEAFRTK